MIDRPVPLRILAVSQLWQGANDYAFVRAFRRGGHSVQVVSESDYLPRWTARPLRAMLRATRSAAVHEFNVAVLQRATSFQPDVFFVFKGAHLKAETINAVRSVGAFAVQFYPDVSFRTHGPYLPRALKAYDWVFTTKSYGLHDMATQLDVANASFLPHAFDPETHRPIPLTELDQHQYGSDVSFIGSWSPKKQAILERVAAAAPSANIKIWGPPKWGALNTLAAAYTGHAVLGDEYAKAIGASGVNIGLLSEARSGASSGDLITARTFEIPAAGGFMLHERTEEAMTYFEDGKECVFFDDTSDLVEKIRYYLVHEEERRAIAAAGRARCLSSGYAVDDRVRTIIEKYHEFRADRMPAEHVNAPTARRGIRYG